MRGKPSEFGALLVLGHGFENALTFEAMEASEAFGEIRVVMEWHPALI